METVILIIMLMVIVSFVLKLTFHGLAGTLSLCAIAAAAIILTLDYATAQSKTQIASWLSQPDLMLDTSVWLTLDVATQIAFCILTGRLLTGSLTHKERVWRGLILWFPGLLIFPVLFSLLVECIFAMPGVDFTLLGWSVAACVFTLMPLLALALKYLLPEPDLRLELLFFISLLTAALGVIATVNGRTAAAGVSSVEWGALAGTLCILAVGAIAGFIIFKIKSSRIQ